MCWWTASYVGLDQMETAREMARRIRTEYPDFTISSWSLARRYRRASDTKHLLDALRNAGLPK